jgi:cell wall-associated NlpC family hydrolase
MMSMAVAGCATRGAAPRPPSAGDRHAPSAIASNIVATALELRGTQYRNGGSEPSQGFDCSGLVQWVFAKHGTALPRETREQYQSGRKIDDDEVQPGDLVFFETVSKGPSHVGIALGGGEFVHAPSSRGVVRVESYNSDYWAGRWLGARRITLLSQQVR